MIIDAHLHCGYRYGYFNYDLRLESLVNLMDKLNIGYALNSNTYDLLYSDFEGGARKDIQLYNRTDGRIMSYLTYNPFVKERCLDVIKNMYDGKVFKGIKIHPAHHQTYADHESYEGVWEYAAKNNIIIISHTWDISLTNPVQKYSFPLHFDKYLKRYSNVKFICAHSGGRYRGIIEAVKLALKYENMFLDTAGDIYSNGFVEYLVKELGSERILFGSDYSITDQRKMLGIILGSRIKTKDKENILYNNASELFKINPKGER